jgi:hypothetical protein
LAARALALLRELFIDLGDRRIANAIQGLLPKATTDRETVGAYVARWLSTLTIEASTVSRYRSLARTVEGLSTFWKHGPVTARQGSKKPRRSVATTGFPNVPRGRIELPTPGFSDLTSASCRRADEGDGCGICAMRAM